MDVFELAEKLIRLDPDSWARHANPKSVFSRIIGGTAVFFALWSGHWIGWLAVVPVGLAALWIYLNPRLFRPPKDASSWSARGVLGERALLNRKTVPIPREHRIVAFLATGASILFLGLFVVAYIQGEFWFGLTAWHAATLAKLWFVDRMVWLWDDVHDDHPVYRRWADGDWSARLPG